MTIEQVATVFAVGFAAGGLTIGRLIFWFDRVRYIKSLSPRRRGRG